MQKDTVVYTIASNLRKEKEDLTVNRYCSYLVSIMATIQIEQTTYVIMIQ